MSTQETAQIEVNMNVVHNILSGIEEVVSDIISFEPKLQVAA
jgi:hypothetical protein